MGTQDTTKKYELVVIVDAKQTSEEKQEILKEVTDVLAKYACKVINNQVWFEKQKFTYPIKKCAEGTYYLVNFEAKGDAIAKARRDIGLKEKVLRASFVLAETK